MWYPILIAFLSAYLLGNLNGAVSISVLFSHEDVRTQGSGNAGLTNFVRGYGGWGTALVLLIDVGKTVLGCLLAGLLLKPYGLYDEGKMLGAVAVTLGHDFPATLGFKGGKGVLCGLAAAAAIDWRIALMIGAAFLITYFITKYVSLGSLMGALFFGIGFCVFWHHKPWVMVGGLFLALMVFIMHRKNIVRLFKGEERKTNLFSGKKQE